MPVGRWPVSSRCQGTGRLMEAWDRFPTAVAGAACGPAHDLVAVAVTDDGSDWLAGVSIDPAHPPPPRAGTGRAPSVSPAATANPTTPGQGHSTGTSAATAVRLVEALGPATTGGGRRQRPWGAGPADGRGPGRQAAAAQADRDHLARCGPGRWPRPSGAGRSRSAGGSAPGSSCPPRSPPTAPSSSSTANAARVSWGSGLARRLAMPGWLAPELGKLRAP